MSSIERRAVILKHWTHFQRSNIGSRVNRNEPPASPPDSRVCLSGSRRSRRSGRPSGPLMNYRARYRRGRHGACSPPTSKPSPPLALRNNFRASNPRPTAQHCHAYRIAQMRWVSFHQRGVLDDRNCPRTKRSRRASPNHLRTNRWSWCQPALHTRTRLRRAAGKASRSSEKAKPRNSWRCPN